MASRRREALTGTFVLDSSALLAFLHGEQGQELVAELLAAADEGRLTVRLHRIHLGEVYYLLYRRGGEKIAEAMVDDVRKLPITIDDRVSPMLMREAAKLKATNRVSYADAFAAGLAKVRDARLVTCDRREFGPLESKAEARVLWAR